jgi:hypothetical protein
MPETLAHPLGTICPMNTTKEMFRASNVERIDGERRRVVRAVREWALALGRPVDALALGTLLVATGRGNGDPERWTCAEVTQLIWLDVVEYCREQELPVPAHVPEAAWAYFGWLAATARLAPGSDRLGLLRAELEVCGGLDGRGHRTARTRAHRKRREAS